MNAPAPAKIPVTLLTGYLGAGKTTLLNHILSSAHGRKYAVVVNEFGAIGVDGALVVGAEEEVFEMSNGCVCCTVRGDLIRVITGLLRRATPFDGILVETTGLADPGPVAQTFFADPAIGARTALDAIVTVVDAKHLPLRLKDSREAEEQIAYADVVVLNKTDLVTPAEREAVEAAIRAINPFARVVRSERGNVPPETILGVGSFDPARIEARLAEALTQEQEGHVCDGSCGHDHPHDHHHHHDPHHDPHHHHDHAPGASRLHDPEVTSLSLESAAPLDPLRFETWMQELLAKEGGNLLRYKGILAFAGQANRVALQGVHMMMEGGDLGPWPANAPRMSRLVFIGRKLNTDALRAAFESCRVAGG